MTELSALGPDDLSRIFECLNQCLNYDQGKRHEAEMNLRGLEARVGFVSCLIVSETHCSLATIFHVVSRFMAFEKL